MNSSNITSTNITASLTNVDSGSMVKYSTFQKVLVGFTLTFISLLTIIGNSLVIYVYRKIKSLQKVRNYFILTLAFADIIVGLVSINVYTVYILVGYWPFSSTLCYVWLVLDHWAITASNFTILAIAFDRFLSVCFPIIHRSIHSKHLYTKRSICLIWILAFLVWGPAILYYADFSSIEQVESQCNINLYHASANVTIAVACFSYFLPVSILTVSYLCISYTLTKRCKNIYTQSVKPVPVTTDSQISLSSYYNNSETPSLDTDDEVSISTKVIHKERSVTSLLHHVKLHKNKSRSTTTLSNFGTCFVSARTHNKFIRANRRGIGFLFFVSLTYIIAWMPYHIMIVVLSTTKAIMPEHLWRFCYVIGWMSSTMNPFCYALGNMNFRRGFKEVVVQKFKKNKNEDNN